MPYTPSEQGSTEQPPAPAPAPPTRTPDADCWVFDVDGCLVDSLTGMTLRPDARPLLEHLAAQRCTVLLWSAGGADYARSVVERFGLARAVTSCHAKDGRDAVGMYTIAGLPLGKGAVVFVDDHPEDLSDRLDVMRVSSYLSDDRHDRGLRQVLRRAGLG